MHFLFRSSLTSLVAAIIFTILATCSNGQDAPTSDWTQWRGPNRDGVAAGLKFPPTLSNEVLVEERSIELQPSYSGPIVVGDTVFVTETVDKKEECVKAINVDDGSTIWSTKWEGSMKVPFFAASNGSWIRATPAYDEGRLFVGGMRDVLLCLDAKDGTVIWRRDFPEEMNKPLPNFGFVSSPLVDGDFVYVQAGGGFLKLEKATGKTVWASLDDGGGMNGSAFSSPHIATLAGKRQAVVLTRTTLHGVDLDTGESLWSETIPAFRGMNIVTPTVFDGGIFLSTYGGTSQFFKVESNGGKFSVKEAWKAGLQGYMCSPVVVNGHAYLHLRNQRFACFDMKTGEVKWRSKPFGKYASLVAAGDQIMALCDDGDLMLIKANPEEFEQVDVRKVADNSWAHLAATKDRVFVRDLKALKIYKWK